MSARTPLVSVVIPVYNGERFLAEAIRSVLAQTYVSWDLTIGNNRSTDGTLALAQQFAAADPRIRVYTYPEHLSVVDSHNMAFTLISDEAEYCQILGADDCYFPNCLEEMVKVAEAYPSVAIVGSYVLNGALVGSLSLPYPSPFVAGREICRRRLLNGIKGFGGPSSQLIRASVVRAKQPFYNPKNYAGDIEAYLDVLKDHDFGFVHQVLTYTRRDAASRTTSYLTRVDSYPAADVYELMKFGPFFLTHSEYDRRFKQVTREYYRMLGRSVIELRNHEFWDYHLRQVREMGYRVRTGKLAWYAFLCLLDLLGNPKSTMEAIIRRIRGRVRKSTREPATSLAPRPALR